MTFSEDDLLKLKNYLQQIIDKPRWISHQPHVRQGPHLWCDDWRIIEVLKYLIYGAAAYEQDPPPNRLKNNPLWSKAQIVADADELYRTCVSADNLINIFKEIREKKYDSST